MIGLGKKNFWICCKLSLVAEKKFVHRKKKGRGFVRRYSTSSTLNHRPCHPQARLLLIPTIQQLCACCSAARQDDAFHPHRDQRWLCAAQVQGQEAAEELDHRKGHRDRRGCLLAVRHNFCTNKRPCGQRLTRRAAGSSSSSSKSSTAPPLPSLRPLLLPMARYDLDPILP